MKLRRKMFRMKYRWLAFFFLFGLAACSSFLSGGQTPVAFIAPTLPPDFTPQIQYNQTPTPTKPAVEIRPSPTPDCTDILSFLEDLSIPDGTIIRPAEKLDKRWLVENTGTCNWNSDYRIQLLSGPSMGFNSEQALFPARSGTQFALRLLLEAPAEAGTYRSAWQAVDPKGKYFGDPFYIDIVVEPQSP